MRVISEITNEYYDQLMAHSNEFLKKHGYTKREGHLYFNIGPFGIHRRPHLVKVVAPRDRDTVLQTFYNSQKMRMGRDTMYQKVRELYGNIPRRYVQDFLRKQEDYQLHLIQPREKVLRPIKEKGINRHWQMDHINMMSFKSPQNRQRGWLLVVIDVFSKYVFVRAQTKHSADKVRDDLEDILEENYRLTGEYPKMIQSDNAPEYKSNIVGEFLESKGIRQIFSPTYMPQAQGIVERFNRTLKNSIFINFTRRVLASPNGTGGKKYIDILDDIVKEYNNTIHSTLKDTPFRIHKPGRASVKQQKIVAERSEKWLSKSRVYTPLHIGDKVRYHILTTAEARKKEIFAKKFVPQWSREVYEVVYIDGEQSAKVKPTYYLKDANGNQLSKKYYRHDLQKIFN